MRIQEGNIAGAIADCTAALEVHDAPTEQIALALSSRAEAKALRGDESAAIDDNTALIRLAQAPSMLVLGAHRNRGILEQKQGHFANAIADFTAALKLPGISKDEFAGLLLLRAGTRLGQRQFKQAIRDVDRALDIKEMSPGLRASGLLIRGAARGCLKLYDEAFSDWLGGLDIRAGVTAVHEALASAAYTIGCTAGWLDQAALAVRKLALAIADKDDETRVRSVTDWLSSLAEPEMKQHWPHACRILIQSLPKELREVLQAFTAVADLLEGNKKSALDTLPPEQREFATKILERFEPTES